MSTMASHGPEVRHLISRIGKAGFGTPFVRRLVPDWWSPEVEAEPGTLTELKILLARRLGIDLSSLLADGPVSLTLPGPVKFKRAARVDEIDVSGPFVAYCAALARNVAACMPAASALPLENPAKERAAILSDPKIRWLSLGALLRRCWTENNIAVVQVVDAPGIARGFDAVTFRTNGRSVVILAKKASHSAWASFVLAHELGHLALGHIADNEALLDESSSPDSAVDDQEESAANAYALALLGGPNLKSVQPVGEPNPGSLAGTAKSMGASTRIDPGHLILRFARESGNWEVAQAALSRLPDGKEVAPIINDIAARFLDFSRVGDDARTSIAEALGIGG